VDGDEVVGVGLRLGTGGQGLSGVLVEVRADRRAGQSGTALGGEDDLLLGELGVDAGVGEVVASPGEAAGDQQHHDDE
jgi:hypothetical protein